MIFAKVNILIFFETILTLLTISYLSTDMTSMFWILLNNNIDQYSLQCTKELLHFTSKTWKHLLHMSLHSKIVSIIRDEQFQINSKIISRWITNYYLPIRMIFTCSMSISWSILILLFTNIRHRLSNPLWEIHMFVNPDIILYFSNTTLIF